jgi:hypothetical protein
MITEEAGTADLESRCQTCQIDEVYDVVHSMMGRLMMLESRVKLLEERLSEAKEVKEAGYDIRKDVLSHR